MRYLVELRGIRTPDLCSAIAALSHLSYSPGPARWVHGGLRAVNCFSRRIPFPRARRARARPRSRGLRRGRRRIDKLQTVNAGNRKMRYAVLDLLLTIIDLYWWVVIAWLRHVLAHRLRRDQHAFASGLFDMARAHRPHRAALRADPQSLADLGRAGLFADDRCCWACNS